jgi:3' exoribonuclease, RNase T-like
MSEVYISVDVETDGPIPGPNSMLSIGAAAFLADRRMLGTFSLNLETLEGAGGDPDTMRWWLTQPEAWAVCRKDLWPPERTMRSFSSWVGSMAAEAQAMEATAKGEATAVQPVFVGYPAGFDFTWVYWYLIKFTGKSPFSFSALDIKTYAAAILGCDYRAVNKRAMGRFKEPGLKHTHVAVDDAIEQGYLFLNLMKARNEAF